MKNERKIEVLEEILSGFNLRTSSYLCVTASILDHNCIISEQELDWFTRYLADWVANNQHDNRVITDDLSLDSGVWDDYDREVRIEWLENQIEKLKIAEK